MVDLWLVYSSDLKSIICKHFVIFHPIVKQGLLRSGTIKECTKYKDFHFLYSVSLI